MLRDEAPDGDRSRQTYRLGCTALRMGLTEGQTLTLAYEHQPSVEKYGPRLPAEIERIAAKRRQETAGGGR